MSDYADIANLSWDEIQAPGVLPEGSYLLKLRNAVFQPSKDADKNPLVLFVYQPKEAMSDVNADELEALGADYDISENKIFHRIYIEDGASWDQVRKHVAKHYPEDQEPPKGKVTDTLKAMKGSEVVGYVVQRAFTRADKTSGIANNVTEFGRVDG